MSKYIDADKLKAELKRQKRELELSIQSQGDYGQSCHIVAYENILSLINSLQQEQPQVADASKMEQSEGYLEYWLEHFGMPKENIENCADQIAQGYGASRFLEGVQVGAEAVNELGKQEKGYDEAYLNECIAKASKSWEGVDADKYMDEVRGREQGQPEVELEKASRNVYESWKGGTMDDFLRDMVELGKALNARKEE